ncbi:MAG: hypothetical protein LLG15_11665 [Betaproteobacteria bacterium]|nr:hypothetical protein [Betaproteobacteria bacterium]
MSPIQDFTPILREALAEIEAAGPAPLIGDIRQRCFASYTTSSEWLGEVGLAINELLNAKGSAIPATAHTKLKLCLHEVSKVWPNFQST